MTFIAGILVTIALFLVGPALGAHGTRSRLYHPGHFHGFRRADPKARTALREAGP